VTVNVPLTQEFMRQTRRKRMVAAHNAAVQRPRDHASNAARVHNEMTPRRRTPSEQPAGRRPHGSLFEAFSYRRLYTLPRNNVVWIRLVVRDAPIKFGTLLIRQRNSRAICCGAVPDLFHEVQSILDCEAVDT
jgi:hypothetical protein